MTTLVGTQTKFKNVLKELIELDYDAIEAYEAAINRLENEKFKTELTKFKEDHQRHVTELNKILEAHNEKKVTGPSTKQWLSKGKVVIANLLGDNAILKAMHSNEEDTNKAYEASCNHEELWDDAEAVLRAGLNDERKHKEWLEANIT